MNSIYLAYNNLLNHRTSTIDGCGCSELQITLLAKSLADAGFDVVCFYTGTEGRIDNVLYRKYNDLINNKNINTDTPLIFWRFFDQIPHLINFYNPNRIILWSQDYKGLGLSGQIAELINNNNIQIVGVSKFHKNSLVDKLVNPSNVTVIYNAVYTGHYKYYTDLSIKKNTITFGTAPQKGLSTIIRLFDSLYTKHPHFQLNILEPSYSRSTSKDWLNKPYVKICNNIKDKKELCQILQSSLCVISTEFPETFGCVFAEAYFLKTPVIATDKINGMHEFINTEHICDLNNYEAFEKLLLSFYYNRPYVSLDVGLLDTNIVNVWKNLILEKISK